MVVDGYPNSGVTPPCDNETDQHGPLLTERRADLSTILLRGARG